MTGLIQCRAPECESWFSLSPLEDLRFNQLRSETDTIGVECPACHTSLMYRSHDLLDELLASYYQHLLAFGHRIGYLKPTMGPIASVLIRARAMATA